MQSLNYNTIIPELNKIFPEFTKEYNLEELTEGLPGVHLSFFISYAREHWNNEKLQEKLADFVNALSESNDDAAKVTFQDFALDFQLHFREHEINIDSFLSLLKAKAKSDFKETLNFWYTANKINKTDGS